MAYPFTPAPTFQEFIDRLQSEFGCLYTVKTDGTPFPIQCIERLCDGRALKCAVHFERDSDAVTPTVAVNILRRLNIAPSVFGYHLD